MAGGLTLNPGWAQDILYPAYQDRLLLKSLGVQAGVVEENDFKVTAGSGLQVEVEKGKSFVEQTKATQESSALFYNGLYNVLSPIKQNPYNSVEVSASNPQIAQIILRVYDKEELGITGNSYARIEWLNGTPNSGATKAHVEEGEAKAKEYGAAELPTSSFRCCYVVVPKNATTSSEFSIVDARGSSQRINKESIITNDIKNEAVTGPKLGSGTVRQETGTTQSFLSWGRVSASGAIEVSSGDFTAARISTGRFKITWNKEKAVTESYVVVCSCPENINGVSVVSTRGERENFEVYVYFKETANNYGFAFIVMSPS